MAERLTLSSLYAAGREGFILGLDAFQRSSVLLLRQPDDGKFELVCVDYDVDAEKHYIHYVDYEEIITIVSISEEAWLCKFVPSNDELVCVAGRADSSNLLWISLMDTWSMSVLFMLDRLEVSGFGHKLSYPRFLTIMENGLVVVGLQNDVEEDPFFGVLVSQLE
ncbi:hypothetical protein FOZ60_002189 [Perkinsus olseni]|uniref:Uncharacterized protein n=1 Tax=Perkinsus olseni TaxID=32597 RepID=A0A7J6NZI9_PEROL|nr:hypothetical protein FOZ60_002189 [Perkinsus olseni]KAF4731682.1 hypothetical protein FOZ62_028599 [Perkinsus olseni]